MSCAMMSPEPMAAIANAVETLINSGFDYFGFDPPNELVSACADLCDGPCTSRPLYCAENVYRRMHALNAAAYNGRYARMGDEEADGMAPSIDGAQYKVHCPPEYGGHHFAVRPWHYKLAMLLDFWLYQTGEDTTRADSLRLGVQAFRDALYQFIVVNSDEYRANQWGRL